MNKDEVPPIITLEHYDAIKEVVLDKPNLVVDFDTFEFIEVKINGATYTLSKKKLLKLIEELKDYATYNK